MGKRNNKSAAKRRNERLQGIEIACKSQVVSELYFKIRDDGRLLRLIGLVQMCSSEGITKEELIKVILKAFPSYISQEELTVGIFDKMCESHSDIANAWGYGLDGDKVSNIMLKNRAFEMAMTSENMEDIYTYNSMYNKEITNINESDVNNETKPRFKFRMTR